MASRQSRGHVQNFKKDVKSKFTCNRLRSGWCTTSTLASPRCVNCYRHPTIAALQNLRKYGDDCGIVYSTANRDAAQENIKKRLFLPPCSIPIGTRAPLYLRELDTGELISYYFWQHFGAPRASLKIARIATLRNAFSLNY